MGLIRRLLSMVLLAAFLYVGFTVPIGERTLFGHVGNIWSSPETQELVDGVKESSGPLVDRVKRGVEAGIGDDEGETPSDQPVGVATPSQELPGLPPAVGGPETKGSGG